MSGSFASTNDLSEKTISFTELGHGLYAFTAESDPNSGVIIGDDGVMVIDTQATPKMAQLVIDRIRAVTDKPITHVVLSHYHAVRVLGASAYGAREILASAVTRSMIHERGQEDWESEFGRFPRLFDAAETIPGLTWPSLTFTDRMTVYLGRRRVELIFLGRAHTAGDIVVWVPDAQVMFSGDIVEYGSSCYCGDAHFQDWLKTLDRLSQFRPEAIVPGRGDAVIGRDKSDEAITLTRDFIQTTWQPVAAAAARGAGLREAFAMCRAACDPKFSTYPIYEHCIPFNVARAYDEACGIDHPRIWTAERDRKMWSDLQQ